MKNKILRFLKKWWWKTLFFILCHFLGIVLLYFADFEKFREFWSYKENKGFIKIRKKIPLIYWTK